MTADGTGNNRSPVPARNKTEADLLRIWQEILPEYEGGVYGNFFEQGGDSMGALHLLGRLAGEYFFEGDALWLIEHPSIAQMGEFFDRSRQVAVKAGKRKVHWTRVKAEVVLLRKGQGETAWVIVPGGHAGENELLNFARMASFLQHPGEVYGVRFNLNDSKVLPPRSFGEISKKVTQALREELKGKRVIFVGECLASVLAWSVAGQFHKSGGRLQRVILLDPWRKGFSTLESKNWGTPAVNKYYDLMRDAIWREGSEKLDVIFSESQWSGPQRDAMAGFNPACHQVVGDHHSYIRQGAFLVAEILDRIGAEEVPEVPVGPLSLVDQIKSWLQAPSFSRS